MATRVPYFGLTALGRLPQPWMVDTAAQVRNMIATILDDVDASHAEQQEQPLFVDFEGVNLWRDGELCLGQIYYQGSEVIYLVDFVSLRRPFDVFIQHRGMSWSLKDIFESTYIPKVFFDPRNDADAIYHQHGVHMRCVVCLQLADVARSRAAGSSGRFVRGLGRVLEEYARGADPEVKAWGKRLFAPEHGGSYDVFKARPLAPEIVAYCCEDVRHFPELLEELFAPLPLSAREWVLYHSALRVEEALDPGYVPDGPHKTVAPSPDGTVRGPDPMDWRCSYCGVANFASRVVCYRCQAPHP